MVPEFVSSDVSCLPQRLSWCPVCECRPWAVPWGGWKWFCLAQALEVWSWGQVAAQVCECPAAAVFDFLPKGPAWVYAWVCSAFAEPPVEVSCVETLGKHIQGIKNLARLYRQAHAQMHAAECRQ
eukprot:1161795-Pelagomonas_calceolata.AAC.6